MSEENYRFLLKDEDSNWEIKIVPKEEAPNWIRGNPEAILLRFTVVSPSGEVNFPCDTKEEAIAKAQEINGRVQVIKPCETIYKNLPQNALDLIYKC